MTQLPTFPFEIALKNQLGSNLGEWEDKPVENYYLIIVGFLAIVWFFFTTPLLTQDDESHADIGEQDIEARTLAQIGNLVFGLKKNHLQDFTDFSEDGRVYNFPINRLTSFRETKIKWRRFMKHKLKKKFLTQYSIIKVKKVITNKKIRKKKFILY